MVKLENILNFSNLMCMFCFLISILDNFVMISKKYAPLSFIVNMYLFIILAGLCFYWIKNETFETDKYLVYTGVYLFSGVLMLGMSAVSIGIGIILITFSLTNYLYYIFVEKNIVRNSRPADLETTDNNDSSNQSVENMPSLN